MFRFNLIVTYTYSYYPLTYSSGLGQILIVVKMFRTYCRTNTTKLFLTNDFCLENDCLVFKELLNDSEYGGNSLTLLQTKVFHVFRSNTTFTSTLTIVTPGLKINNNLWIMSFVRITVEAPYSRFLHSRFHYSRIEKLRPNSHIRGLKFLYSRIESKYRCVT